MKMRNKIMRFKCIFDDGEMIQSFHTLAEAIEYRAKNNFRFLSRRILIIDEWENKIIKG